MSLVVVLVGCLMVPVTATRGIGGHPGGLCPPSPPFCCQFG